jgi:hypothetical protein
MEWKHQVAMITEILQTRREIKEAQEMDIPETEKNRIVSIMTSHYDMLWFMLEQLGGDMDALRAAITKQNLESE